MTAAIPSRRHDATGRSTKVIGNPRLRKLNSPPSEEAWIWLTRALLESYAWRAMTDHGIRVVFRLLIEHSAHGGVMNGALAATYDDFVSYGARRNQVKPAIAEVEALGLIARTGRGHRPYGPFKGAAATYRIEWLPAKDGAPAADTWKRFETLDQARAAGAAARSAITSTRAPRAGWRERLDMLAAKGTAP